MIRPDQRVVEPRFLFWMLRSTVASEWFASQATGVTRFGLRRQSIEGLEIYLPHLAFQQRVVEFLDGETARVDALIEKKQRMLYLLEDRWRAALSSALDPGTGLRLKHLLASPLAYGVLVPEHDNEGVPYAQNPPTCAAASLTLAECHAHTSCAVD